MTHPTNDHPICPKCAKREYPKLKAPKETDNSITDICCWCEAGTNAGLYVADERSKVPVHNGTSPSGVVMA